MHNSQYSSTVLNNPLVSPAPLCLAQTEQKMYHFLQLEQMKQMFYLLYSATQALKISSRRPARTSRARNNLFCVSVRKHYEIAYSHLVKPATYKMAKAVYFEVEKSEEKICVSKFFLSSFFRRLN